MSKIKGGENTAEIIIIGGGIMGISTAYFLAKQGVKGIILLERDYLAEASTGLSVGGFRQQFSHPANILLSQESIRLFKRFKDEFGTDIDLFLGGYLFLTSSQKTWNQLLNDIRIQRQHDVPVEALSHKEISYRWPFLITDDLKGGTFCDQDGYVDPYQVAMTLAKIAKREGVRIEEKTEVVNIKVSGGRTRGVDTTKGTLHSPIVIITAGAWCADVAGMANINLPIKPFRRQVFVTNDFFEIDRPVPMIIDVDMRHYFRSEDKGILMGMSDLNEPSSFNTHVDWDFLEKVVEILIARAPVLKNSEILRGWAGLYAVTPDENPIIGKLSGIDGLFCAGGFSGHGFQHGPAVGRIMSELVINGNSEFDLTPFSADRFIEKRDKGEKRAV